MRKRNSAIGLLIVSLVLFALQAGIWMQSHPRARTETDKQNIEQRHPPNEIAGIAATLVLLAAAVVASTPRHSVEHRSHV